MPNNPYTDPTTGEIVGEHERTNAEGEVSRQTEWFATEDEAKHFIKTGQFLPIYLTHGEIVRLISAARGGQVLELPSGSTDTDPQALRLPDVPGNLWARNLVRQWRVGFNRTAEGS